MMHLMKKQLSFLRVQHWNLVDVTLKNGVSKAAADSSLGTENAEPTAGVILSFVPPMATHRESRMHNM